MCDEIVKRRGRPQKSSSQGKEQLLQAALEIFSRKGFDGTNIREIAEKAKVDVALINHHFGSKIDLWKEVVNTIEAKFSEKFNENTISTNNKNFRIQAINLLEQFVEIAITIPEFSVLTSIESVESDRHNYMVEKFFAPLRKLIIPLVKKGIDEGIFAKQNEEILFAMILGSVTYQIANSHTIKKFSKLPHDKEKWVKEIKNSLIVNFVKG